MKTTLEEVKEYFKNAKTINTPVGGMDYEIDVEKFGIYYDDESTIRQKNNENGQRILLYYKGEYSEIISYKDEPIGKAEQLQTPNHYDNSKGSLYQFCENQNLNSYEFDIIKRVMRCRKKGNFKEDLEKTKFLIDLYLKEYEK
jgi:transcriptional accessory protein Tex/SPT6